MNKNLRSQHALKKIAIAFSLMLAAAAAQAQTNVLYRFGTQIASPVSTTFQPSDTFATLSVTSADSMHYVFDLQTTWNFGALFGNPGASVLTVAFNTNNVDPVAASVQLLSGSTGVGGIWYSPSGTVVGGITFDFYDGFWGNSAASSVLTSGERAVWGATFAAPTDFVSPPFALKVLGVGGNDYSFAWYAPSSVTPVPEPETYGMLLAGLGMLGFAARRRKQKEVAAA